MLAYADAKSAYVADAAVPYSGVTVAPFFFSLSFFAYTYARPAYPGSPGARVHAYATGALDAYSIRAKSVSAASAALNREERREATAIFGNFQSEVGPRLRGPTFTI